MALFVGQSFDLHWTHNSVCPSISEYTAMVDNSKYECHRPTSQNSNSFQKPRTLFNLLTDLMSSRASNKVPDLHTLATLTASLLSNSR